MCSLEHGQAWYVFKIIRDITWSFFISHNHVLPYEGVVGAFIMGCMLQ